MERTAIMSRFACTDTALEEQTLKGECFQMENTRKFNNEGAQREGIRDMGHRKMPVKKMVLIGMFSAISVILVYLFRLSLFPMAPFLEYDMADIPIILITFMYGPSAGLITTVIVSVIQGVTVSAGSGWIGIVMHIFATGSYVLVAGNIYKRRKNIGWEIIAMVAGTLTMTISMVLWNMVFTPIFMGRAIETVLPILVPAIIPFNLFKAGVNSLAAYFVFKVLQQVIKKTKISL